MAQILIEEGIAPSTPATGKVTIYAKSDGLVYSKDDAGTESALGVALPISTTNGGTNITSYTTGDILYASATNVLSKLPIGSNGEVLTVNAGIPDWQAGGGSGTVTSVAVSGGTTGLTTTGSPITTSGTITLTGTLEDQNGGTGFSTYTTGDVIYASASNVLSKLPIGATDEVLTVVAGVPSWEPSSGGASGHGQCILVKSGANLVLLPKNGRSLIINGTTETIPSAGVSLASPATTVTLYYIYAFMSGGTMTLEASTTAYATDTTTGVVIKSADATRTLVGMARTLTNAWVDTTTQRFVRTWFNDSGVFVDNQFTALRTTTSATFVELNTEIRNEFLVWNTEIVDAKAKGAFATSAIGTTGAGLGLDSASLVSGSSCAGTSSPANNVCPMYCSFTSSPSEGYHYSTVLGTTNAGTATFGSGVGGSNRFISLQTKTRGLS